MLLFLLLLLFSIMVVLNILLSSSLDLHLSHPQSQEVEPQLGEVVIWRERQIGTRCWSPSRVEEDTSRERKPEMEAGAWSWGRRAALQRSDLV